MHQKSKISDIIYRKLVRDKIPEIIKKHSKLPFTRKIEGKAYHTAVGQKILEEAYELFSKWVKEDTNGVLKESADMLEIILAALKEHGYELNDLLKERLDRIKERGSFKKRIFLENVGAISTDDLKSYRTPTMIFSPHSENQLIDLINAEFSQSESAWIVSAFYTPGITNLLISSFEQFIESGGILKILLSTMGNITRPEYFIHLKTFVPGAHLKVFHPPGLPFDKSPPDFHVKIYLFRRRSGEGTMLIGSSNFTEAGFVKNIEWNYFTPGEINLPFEDISPFQTALDEFDRYWNNASVEITEDFIDGYKQRWQPVFGFHPQTKWPILEEDKKEIFEEQKIWGFPEITPNDAQKEALENLSMMRSQGVNKAAIIAATGVGKTYLAAFDFKQNDSQRLLYIAQRENILRKSIDSFRNVLGNTRFGEILGGGKLLHQGSNGVFAMIQTLSKAAHMSKFDPEEFDYIVMDEFHHSEATTYRRVLNYFKPRFLLGLTATPERMDGRDVLAHCDYNIGYEVRILEAVDRGWLAPFQYFAVYDETDYSQIAWHGVRYDETELDKALINDTRTEIVARNLKKYLPSKGKIKTLAFCSSVAHAKYTAKCLTHDHGIESVSLVGLSTEDERQTAIDRLGSEDDKLEVICSVDIFNEGIDIPELTHVLFLRPTQSFTIFLQQLGRGLRKAHGKDFLVAIDFVGNFRKAHVAPLALSGYTSMQAYIEDYLTLRDAKPWQQLPQGCYLSKDLEVQRIWDEEIRKIIKEQLSPEERLKALFIEIKSDLDDRSPFLMDFFASTYDVDPYVFIKQFGNWIRAKHYCEEGLTGYEERLLGTIGEAFLQHIEKELNPVKSYKMVVLKTLLEMPNTNWQIEDIAKGFLGYYLKHRDKIFDYDDLAKASDPGAFALSRVVTKLKQMPLHFLSNTKDDYFILDKDNDKFSLKPDIYDYWTNENYKALLRDRIDFALSRYFQRRSLRQAVYYDPVMINEELPMEPHFAKAFLGEDPILPGGSKRIKLILGNENFNVNIKRSDNGKKYAVSYGVGNNIKERLSGFLIPVPEKGAKIFYLYNENGALRLEAVRKTADLRGILLDIKYAAKKNSGYTAQFRRILDEEPESGSWRMVFEKGGYEGDMDVDIRDGNSFLAWTGSRYKDKTRFPARIKAAATALFAEGFRGEFHITAKEKKVSIYRKETKDDKQ